MQKIHFKSRGLFGAAIAKVDANQYAAMRPYRVYCKVRLGRAHKLDGQCMDSAVEWDRPGSPDPATKDIERQDLLLDLCRKISGISLGGAVA
jgi:hypothetical protein